MQLSVVIPALNESQSITQVVNTVFKGLQIAGIDGEVIVADNGSSDGTADLARKAGAKVTLVVQKGYGNAIQGGCAVAQGQWILIADGDNTYNFRDIKFYVTKLKDGYDFVIGNRFKGRYIPQSMPFLHRYLGTPVLTMLADLFFRSGIGDINCGMRAFSKEAYTRMGLCSPGMEFASEMVAKASLAKLKITEVPCTLYPARKNRQPHLRAWRDGWRHLKLLCLIFLQKRGRFVS